VRGTSDRDAQCRARLLRVEASLVYPWWPNDLHMVFSDHLKKTIATFRVGTWYLAHMTEYVDPLHAERSLSWLVVSYVMPHIGLGWMAPGWLPVSPPFAVEDRDAARDGSAPNEVVTSDEECDGVSDESVWEGFPDRCAIM
jgi:hypothetical protein